MVQHKKDSAKRNARRAGARMERRERATAKRRRRRIFYGTLGSLVGLALIAGLFIPQLGQLG